jgi:exodeoxyribonuclease VIII
MNKIIHGMPFSDYLAAPGVSSSGLRAFARSPWHYRHRQPPEQTRPMLRGQLAHAAILEPDALAARYIVVPEDAPRRPTAAQWAAAKPNESSRAAMDWWREFNARAEGREIITADEWATASAQLAAIRDNPALADILRDGQSEVSVFWTDADTGLACKARIDWLASDGRVLELKTAADESPNGFGRAAARMRYDLQRAHYLAGLEACGILATWTWAAVSSEAPALAVAYDLTAELEMQSFEDHAELLTHLAQCEASGHWPAYGSGILELDFPAWAKRGGEVEVSFVES